MKVSAIRIGTTYHNGKDGVRKVIAIQNVTNPMQDVVQVVTYTILAAKQAQTWNTSTQQMESLIGTSSTMSLQSFAAWAKTAHDDAGAAQLLRNLQVTKIKLPPGELAYMSSVRAEAPDAKAGTCITFDHTEGRAVTGLAKKGLVIRQDGQVELTAMGEAWLQHCK